jgi:hypothetical protein
MEEIAKLLVVGVFIALFIQTVKHGPAGPKMWWRAKFLGQLSQGVEDASLKGRPNFGSTVIRPPGRRAR